MTSPRSQLTRYRVTLTLIWWIWGPLLFMLLAALTLQPAIFGEAADSAWDWFLPNVMPTLLLVGATSYATRGPSEVEAGAVRSLFLLATIISIVYLLMLTVAMVGVFYSADPIALLRKSSLWLGPMQGLAASTLGVFFTK